MLARVASITILSLTLIMGPGLVPARATNPTLHAPIIIQSNSDFTVDNGVTGGNGTAADPYIIEGWEIASPPTYGILIQNTNAHFVIRDVDVHDAFSDSSFGAVDLEGVANGRLENVTILDNNRLVGALVVQAQNWNYQASTKITITHSRILSNYGGVIIHGPSQNVTISNNLVQSNLVGIIVGAYTRDVSVIGNYVLSNTFGGISVTYCLCVVSGNIVDHNGFGGVYSYYGPSGYGISAIRRCECLIVDNTVSNNSIGLVINDAPPAFHNNFINNVVQVESGCPFELCVRPFDDGYPSGGNYWSDYAVVDNCSGPNQDVCPSPDGIADQPLFVDSCFAPCSTRPYIDHYPLREPFASLVTGKARFAPSSILSQSTSKFITAIIGLPQGFSASNLLPRSIRLNETVAALRVSPVTQPNETQVLIVTFNLTQAKAFLSKPGLYLLKISGNILTSKNFRPFEATSTIHLLPG